MKNKSLKFWFAVLLIVTFGFVFLSRQETQNHIIICASTEQFRNDDLQQQLNEKFPQYNITVMYMPTGKAAAKIYAEKENSEVDIVIALENGYLYNIAEYLDSVEGISDVEYLEEMTPEANENLWITWERYAGSIVVNTEILEKYGLEAPKSYEDLLKPEYKGLVAMPDPKSSGTGYLFYKNWVNTMGEEEALAYIDELYNNIKQFTESGSGPMKMLRQGEIAVGLGLTFQAVNAISDGHPLEIIFPEEGSPYSLSGTAVIKKHMEKEGVREVFEFIANDFFKYDKENFSPEKVYENQINNIEGYPQDIEYADMTGIYDLNEKERLLELWKY